MLRNTAMVHNMEQHDGKRIWNMSETTITTIEPGSRRRPPERSW